MTLTIVTGVILILIGALLTWGSLRGLTIHRPKPRQRIDPSVFMVMELQALEFHPKSIPPTNMPRSRRDSLNLEAPDNEAETTPGAALFGKSTKTTGNSSSSTLHMRSLDNGTEGDPKTLGL